ncbi:hypothetical protein RJ640_017519 [Escallonia rubra]|uniref:Protein EARLY RESPONSIVE TO DEHYDRATION 15 n=1 Tax=Escallonia rubra TaxID=112253 RepID=A0AA88RRT3_9ASTE|nr:hypothetical protein RJ640_017519 [Escallonia rubra]
MALVSGGRSTLNPNAPLFILAVVRQVEDFSPEWWQLVTTSTWFHDYWLSQHQGEDGFYANLLLSDSSVEEINSLSNKLLPYKLLLKSSSLLSPPMRSCTKPCRHPITISICPFVHALHHPVAARFHPRSRRVTKLHGGTAARRDRRRHLRYSQCLTLQLNHGPPKLLHHALHFIQMTPLQGLRRRTPVQRICFHAEPIAQNGIKFLQKVIIKLILRFL